MLLSVAVLLAVTVTGAVLFMNHYHAPSTEPPPVITTNMEDPNALVTIERADSSHINIFIDPNCPDPLPRLDGLQSSLMSALADHDLEMKAAVGKERALLAGLADQVSQMVSQVSRQRADWENLRKGQSGLVSELGALQSEQGRLIQVTPHITHHPLLGDNQYGHPLGLSPSFPTFLNGKPVQLYIPIHSGNKESWVPTPMEARSFLTHCVCMMPMKVELPLK